MGLSGWEGLSGWDLWASWPVARLENLALHLAVLAEVELVGEGCT